MNIDQLKYLDDLSKTSSINTTAKRMFISQQALSESMKRLEQELGCTLFIRSKTGISFTEDGKMLLDCAQHMLEQYNVMMQYLNTKYNKTHLQGKLTLGVAPAVTSSFLPELLLNLHTHYPDVTLYVQEHSAKQILKLLSENLIDFGLFGFSEDGVTHPELFHASLLEAFRFEKLYTDYLVCAMLKNHPLSIYTTINTAQLYSLKATMYAHNTDAKPEGPCYHVSNNTQIHQQFMREEGTVCCMPFQLFQALYSRKEFVCRPVTDAKPIACYLVYRNDADFLASPLCQTFIETARTIIPDNEP